MEACWRAPCCACGWSPAWPGTARYDRAKRGPCHGRVFAAQRRTGHWCSPDHRSSEHASRPDGAPVTELDVPGPTSVDPDAPARNSALETQAPGERYFRHPGDVIRLVLWAVVTIVLALFVSIASD